VTQDAVAVEAPEWSTDRIAKTFRDELAERFRAHNEAYRVREEAELAEVLRAHPEKRGTPGYDVRDSFAREFLDHCLIEVESNTATIVMPIGFAFRPDLLPLFDHTSVAWSRPFIGARIVDGVARPTIEITLVATWSDEMDAKWRAEGHARKQIAVDLFEDDVRELLGLVADRLAQVTRPVHVLLGEVPAAAGDLHGIRERLTLALEPLP